MRRLLARPFRWIANTLDPPVITSAMIVDVRPGIVKIGDASEGVPLAEIVGPAEIVDNLKVGD